MLTALTRGAGTMRCWHCIAAACVLSLALHATAQSEPVAQPWTVETLVTRRFAEGGPATTAVAVRLPPDQPVKQVVLYLSPNETPFINVRSGPFALELIGPWVRASSALAERGIAVAFADAPSDARGRTQAMRPSGEVRQDIDAVVAHLQKSFAGTPIHLGAFGIGAAPALDVAARVDGISRVVIASGAFLTSRNRDWRGLKQPVMVIHAPSATCGPTPFIEVQWVARKNGFTLVEAGYDKPAAAFECGRGSHHLLSGLESAFADAVSRWFAGAEVPKHIGHPNPPRAWREQIVTYPAPGVIGVNQLEMTLMLPDGPGPFPVALFNHGDVDFDSAFVRGRQRMRELTVAWAFLQNSIAFAVPARRGVAMSEGNYPRTFARHDGDPTYKARIHAQDILPALDYLKTRPEIDAQRIILAGQSAGAFGIMHIASTRPPGVIGTVNWSGGRTDSTLWESASSLNKMMVSGFETLGRTTRIPSLWVFAANDSKYSVDTIRASHDAYVNAGGNARLLLTPPTPDDGHFVYHRPELWGEALKDFLRDIGALKPEAPTER